MEIKTVDPGALVSNPKNARIHGEENISAIMASLTKFGQIEPLVVQKGTNIVIGGNGRLSAILKLGLKECKIVEIEMTDSEAAMLGLALNRTAEMAEWNSATLLSELPVLIATDPGFMQLLDFDREYLNKLVEIVVPAPAEPPAEDPPAVADLTTCPKCGARF